MHGLGLADCTLRLRAAIFVNLVAMRKAVAAGKAILPKPNLELLESSVYLFRSAHNSSLHKITRVHLLCVVLLEARLSWLI